MSNKTDEARENLDKFLTIEKILNEFYTYFDFCLEKCVKPAIEKNNGNEVAVCCRDKYYKIYDLPHPSFDLLRSEREELYGKPSDIKNTSLVSPCEYHGEKGCVLPTHKSPICISFMCRKSIDELRDRYGIYQYDYLGFNYALEWILTGDMSHKDYLEFKESCLDMIRVMQKAAT